MARSRTKRKTTALITGASAGIGRELATVFAEHGHDLILVARTKRKLDAVADELHGKHGVRATVIPKDLTEAGAAKSLFASVKRRKIDVDILVNDAGIVEHGPFLEMNVSRVTKIIERPVGLLVSARGAQ